MPAAMQDVEMTEPEVVHSLQIKFDDAADLVAGFTAISKPDQAIQLYQEILSYHGTFRQRSILELFALRDCLPLVLRSLSTFTLRDSCTNGMLHLTTVQMRRTRPVTRCSA